MTAKSTYSSGSVDNVVPRKWPYTIAGAIIFPSLLLLLWMLLASNEFLSPMLLGMPPGTSDDVGMAGLLYAIPFMFIVYPVVTGAALYYGAKAGKWYWRRKYVADEVVTTTSFPQTKNFIYLPVIFLLVFFSVFSLLNFILMSVGFIRHDVVPMGDEQFLFFSVLFSILFIPLSIVIMIVSLIILNPVASRLEEFRKEHSQWNRSQWLSSFIAWWLVLLGILVAGNALITIVYTVPSQRMYGEQMRQEQERLQETSQAYEEVVGPYGELATSSEESVSQENIDDLPSIPIPSPPL